MASLTDECVLHTFVYPYYIIILSNSNQQGIEVLSIDFEFPPYIVTGQECIDKVTSPECLAVSTKDHPPRTRDCKKVK